MIHKRGALGQRRPSWGQVGTKEVAAQRRPVVMASCLYGKFGKCLEREIILPKSGCPREEAAAVPSSGG